MALQCKKVGTISLSVLFKENIFVSIQQFNFVRKYLSVQLFEQMDNHAKSQEEM